ncbi:Growth hormone-inducible transmembrane protein [Sarcoptes scabiei]|nr:Growth hormone-inducible transmembrane protein [Sarcoptes scabiei]UXI21558.1 hypothetical protein NH340_JMT07501 [Sarcoptes scabiei]
MSIFLRNPNLFKCFRQTADMSSIKFFPVQNLGSESLIKVRFFSVGRRGGRTAGSRVVARVMPVTKERRSLKEILMQPTSGAPFAIGSSAVAGASLFGIGALCYYGLGMSNTAGTFENAYAWPKYVRDRVRDTYLYFGSGLGITAASAVAAFRSPVVMNLVTKTSFTGILLTIGAMIGTSILAQSIPYKEGFGAKQLAWALHCGVVGAVIAPLCILGGPLMMRAAVYTAGIAGGLSAIAYCAPNDKFLNIGGPLAIGLGFVFAASMGSMFLAPTTALGSSLYSISLYGGLLLFSAFLLYDTQRIIRKAETHSPYSMQRYDPVNASISIYMDVINIFVRLVTILAGGGSGSKRR